MNKTTPCHDCEPAFDALEKEKAELLDALAIAYDALNSTFTHHWTHNPVENPGCRVCQARIALAPLFIFKKDDEP